MKLKKNKIDEINDAFIEILAKENAKGYEEYIKSINRELIDNIETLDAKRVKQIIQSAKINVDNMALLFLIQNAVLLILGKKLTKKEKQPLLPIIALLGLYSINNPKRFVSKVIRINKGRKLTKREKQAYEIIQTFKKDNKKVLESARKIARNQLDTSILKSKTSQRMIRDMRKGLKEQKSIEQIKNSLVKRYNKLSNVERALDTELHAQSEFVRQEHSKALGYTHKEWKTQGDARVRETNFHKQVRNKRVPIDSDFRAAGLKAEHPGDVRLPAKERIRCRCYTVYS